ncbi:MAG: hypothetical protein ABSB88_09625 [Bryobacteraceae bacterium]|jgi:hypothetical protein
MATDKQITANRINAQKSTGPRSAAGKSRSAQNSRKHGFAVSIFTVPHLEDSEEIVNLRQDALDVYHPANSQELWAVERIALCQLSLIRTSRLEAGLLTNCLDQALGSDGEPIHPMNERISGLCNSEITIGQLDNFSIAEAFSRMTRKPHTFALFLRYQAQAERNYRRAIQEFERLRVLRPELEAEETEIPDEPNFPVQPEANNPDRRLETDPISTVGQAPLPACDPLVALPPSLTANPAGQNGHCHPIPALGME